MKILLHLAPGAAVLDAGYRSGQDSPHFMQACSAT